MICMYKKYLRLPVFFFCLAFLFCYAGGILNRHATMAKSERVRRVVWFSNGRQIAALRQAKRSPPVGADIAGVDRAISQLREENRRLLATQLERAAEFSAMEWYVWGPARAALILAAASSALLLMFLVPYRRSRAKGEHIELVQPTS